MSTVKWHEGDSGAMFPVYQTIFNYLSRVYLEMPEAGFINGIVSENLFSQWPLFTGDASLAKGIELMREFSKKWNAAQIPGLTLDYTRLFIGFERTLAPPYESVYLGKYHVMFEKQTLEVRKFYQDFGLQVKKKNVEPDDHIGLELLFVAHLCGLLSEPAGRPAIIPKLKEFLSTHLLCWLPLFLQRVLEHAQTGYFLAAAYLTEGTVRDISELLKVFGGVGTFFQKGSDPPEANGYELHKKDHLNL